MDISDISQVASRKRVLADAQTLREKVSKEAANIVKLRVEQDTAYWEVKEKLSDVEREHGRLQQNMIEMQMQHENLSSQYQDELRMRPETLNRLSGTREICDVLEEYVGRVRDTLQRCAEDKSVLSDAYARASSVVATTRADIERQVASVAHQARAEREQLRQSVEQYSQSLKNAEAARERSEAAAAEARAQLSASNNEVERLRDHRDTLSTQLARRDALFEERERTIAELREDIKKINKESSDEREKMNTVLLGLERESAKKAALYDALKELEGRNEADAREITRSREALAAAEARADTNARDATTLREALAATEARADLNSRDATTLRELLAAAETRADTNARDVTALREALAAVEARADTNARDVNTLREALAAAEMRTEANARDSTTLRDMLAVAEARAEANACEATALREALTEAEARADKNAHDANALREALAAANTHVIAIEAENVELRNSLDTTKVELGSASSTVKELSLRVQENLAIINDLQHKLKASGEETAMLRMEVTAKNQVIEKLEERVRYLKHENEEQAAEQQRLAVTLHDVIAERDTKQRQLDEHRAESASAAELAARDREKLADTVARLMRELSKESEARLRADSALADTTTELDSTRANCTRAEEETRRLNNLLREKENEAADQLKIILEMKSEKERLQEKIRSMRLTIDNIQNEIVRGPPLTTKVNRDAPEQDKSTLRFTQKMFVKPEQRKPMSERSRQIDPMLYNFFSDNSMESDALDPAEVTERFEALSRDIGVSPASSSHSSRATTTRKELGQHNVTLSLSQVRESMKARASKNKRQESRVKKIGK